MNQIHDLPTERDFGLDFNYAAWTPGTVVMLCNVPWNSDYRDIVRFPNQAALDSYLDNSAGPKVSLTGLTYANPGEPVRIDLPLNAVYKYNYIRVFNPAQPITGDEPRAFYYFITEPRRLSPNATQINVQLDVWQTFGYGISFGNCYIERGHIGIANVNQFSNFGRDYLTVPEGLDIGGEYQIEKQYVQSVADARDSDPGLGGENYNIMVVSALDLTADPGIKDDPNIITGPGSQWENLPNGATIYIFNTTQFRNFLIEFRDKPWVTQGIMSISVVPYNGIYFSEGETVSIGDNIVATMPEMKSMDRRAVQVAPNWRDTINLGRYARLKKLLVYPYCVMEMTSYTGTPLMLKPESWNDPNGTVMELPHFAPPNPRLAFYPYRYNAGPNSLPVSDDMGVLNDGGEFLDMQTGIMNFPQFSIVNDGGIAYLASNANSIAYQHRSADWAQQRAATGATTAYNQASSGIGTSKETNQIGIGASQRQTSLANETAGLNAISGTVFGAMSSGPGKGGQALLGGAQNAVSYAITEHQNTMGNIIATGASAAANKAQNQNAAYVRDTNLDYANYANKGDYENQIAGIQAKIQDAALIQPTTSGQVGGDAFLLALYKWGYDLKVKMVAGAALRQVGEFMLRYGYQVNQFGRMPANFMVMDKATYWKLTETYILGASCPEQFKQAIRGIFEKGVTVWSNPSYIGNIDWADNVPLEGIVL